MSTFLLMQSSLPSSLTRMVTVLLRFNGRSCKNFQGGLRQQKVEAKDPKIYADQSLRERCIVSCFERYLSLIPKNGPFYSRPIGDNPPRYSVQASESILWKRLWRIFVMKRVFLDNIQTTLEKWHALQNYFEIMLTNNSLCNRQGTVVRML